MLFWLVLSAFAAPEPPSFADRYRDTTNWPDLESKLRRDCSSAKFAAQAAQLMDRTTAQAQLFTDQLPVLTAGVLAYPTMLAVKYPGKLSKRDWEFILVRVGEINHYALSHGTDLKARIQASHNSITLLLERPPRRLRRNERAEVVEMCVNDRLLTLRALVVMTQTAFQVEDDLKRLHDDIMAQAAVKP